MLYYIMSAENTDVEKVEDKKISLEKPKKPRSEKQIEQFKKIAETRKSNVEQRKLEKKIEASKLLLEHDIKPVTKKEKKQPIVITKESESESDSEPEIIVVSKKKPKKKPIKIEIEESSSEEEVKEPKQREFKHQNYKKSIIKQLPAKEEIKPSVFINRNTVFFD